MPSEPRGVAIPVPGARIGNSSSSGIGIGGPILPLMDDPVFDREGASDLHLPGDLNLLIVPAGVAVLAQSGIHKKS